MGIVSQFNKYHANYMKLGRCPHILYTALALTSFIADIDLLLQSSVHFWYVDAAGNHFQLCFLKYFQQEVNRIRALKAIFCVTTTVWWSTLWEI